MGFLMKIITTGIIATIILIASMDTKKAIKTGQDMISMINQKQAEITIKRVCKIKPNGDEECRNIPTE